MDSSEDFISLQSAPGDVTERGGLVSARGTGHGLAIRLDGRVSKESLFSAIGEYMSTRTHFLGGQQVSLEWVGQKPEEAFERDVAELLSKDFQISVRTSKLKEARKPEIVKDVEVDFSKASNKEVEMTPKPMSLFDGVGAIGLSEAAIDEEGPVGRRAFGNENERMPSGDALLWDDPDARIIYVTLRSGQRIETEHSLVIIGDVNSGAEVVAGGDIIVLGTLRGVAHAGAYDETGGGRFIIAHNLKPTQLRIGVVISRGAADGGKVPEIARVDGNLIVVEPYLAKNLANIRRV